MTEPVHRAAPGAPLWAAGSWRWVATPDRRLLLLSVVLQLALAVVFGHSYDTRVFMAAGYLAGTGQNPYVAPDLMHVFHHLYFNVRTSVGYPPPWPLLAGLIYRATYAVVPNLYLYNLVLKLPVIAADLGLAYLVAAVLRSSGADLAVARRAWVFLLFNPLLLYMGAAWGQIDAIVALMTLAALVLVYAGRADGSALLLALAVCVKPIGLPVVVVILVYLLGRSAWRAVRYAVLFVAGALVFYVLPFPLFGWQAKTVLEHVNAHFRLYGAMSFMTVVRLWREPQLMQGHWWLLGLVWAPALAVAILALRRGVDGFDDLLRKSTALVLVFFLTRTWLAEPNVVLLLPLALILTSRAELDRRLLTALWALPLLFTVFNASPLHLLYIAAPGTMMRWLATYARHEDATLIARAAAVVAWQIAGWWTVVACLRRRPAPVLGGGASLEEAVT